MRRLDTLERLALAWLVGKVVTDGMAWLVAIGAGIAALVAGAVLWRDLLRLVAG